MKNKDLIKKLQELDPEMVIVLGVWEDYSLLEEIVIKTAGSCVGRGDSICGIYDFHKDKKVIVLSDAN